MATPTPMKHAPSQQGRTPSQTQHGVAATPPVSTPFSATQGHAAFSPHGPKSSPQHVKRSPATTATMGASHPSNPPVNFDSPTAAALGALGIGNSLDMGLDHVGVGGLGGLVPVERDDDDERAKRLKQIIDMLKVSKGRVSEAGLLRLVKSLGLDCVWEPSAGPSDQPKTLIVAGSALEVDIVISNNIVKQVTLSFPGSAEIVSRHVDRAGQILFDDLKLGPYESPLTKTLDKFALNLERLALLDRLSVIPGFNCHEAIAGIDESLERLHQWDITKLREDAGTQDNGEETLITTAMCSRHGLPVMHRQGRVGLTLDYWKEHHLVPPRSPEEKEHADLKERTWGIWIGCTPITDINFQPARISSSWISERIEKPLMEAGEELLAVTAAGQPILDWQEPDNTFIPPSEDELKAAQMGGMDPAFPVTKLPQVVFTAELDPPVTIPLHECEQIYQITGARPLNEFSLATFDSLIFPIPARTHHDPSEPRTITSEREVPVLDRSGDRSSSSAVHSNTLFIYKPVYGRMLSSVEFAHPKALIDVLPRLRQYAFLSTLLEKSFGSPPSPSPGSDAANGHVNGQGSKGDSKKQGVPGNVGDKAVATNIWDAFNAFLEGADDSSSSKGKGKAPMYKPTTAEGTVSIDVTLTVHPVPRLQVVFPFRGRTATIVLDILFNGVVEIVSQNVLPETGSEGAGDDAQITPAKLGRVLQVCEDLGAWCEWIKSRLE